MAITIKSIPVLKDKEAYLFNQKAERNAQNRGTIKFDKQAKTASKILEKSKLK